MPPVVLVHARDTVVPRASKTAAEGSAVQEPSSETAFQVLDRAAHAAISQATLGISPAALGGAFFDWWVHLAFSPGKQADLAQQAIAGTADNLAFAAQSASGSPSDPSERALPHDDRFRAPDWQAFPFNVYALAPRGITCVVVNPGWVETDMGGPGATLTPQESVTALRRLIARFGQNNSGKFYHYDGREYPW